MRMMSMTNGFEGSVTLTTTELRRLLTLAKLGLAHCEEIIADCEDLATVRTLLHEVES